MKTWRRQFDEAENKYLHEDERLFKVTLNRARHGCWLDGLLA